MKVSFILIQTPGAHLQQLSVKGNPLSHGTNNNRVFGAASKARKRADRFDTRN